MSPGRQSIKEFIEKYKEMECLWKKNHKDYKNRQKRLNAMEQLLQILKKTDENTNMDTVTKRINSLRCAFNKELNKVKASYRSGKDDVHIPKLWYYDLLLFLSDRDTESRRSSDCDIDAAMIENSTDSQGMDTITEMEQGSPQPQYNLTTSVSQQNSQDNSTITNNATRKINDAATEVLTKISEKINPSVSNTKPPFSAFGEHVAEKLRTMNKDSAKYCQKIINDAIFHAEFNNLNYTSRIVTDYQQHFQSLNQPSTSAHVQFPYQSPPQILHQTSPPPSPSNQVQSPYRLPHQEDRKKRKK